MLVTIYGPLTIGPTKLNDGAISCRVAKPIESDARTLGEALRFFEQVADAIVRPYDVTFPDLAFADGEAPKYFLVAKRVRPEDERLVDIHIDRSGKVICPKQNLAFPLEDGDVLRFGELAC